MDKKLFRSNRNKVIAGVCGGIAEYFGVDPTIVRIIWLICILPGGIGLIAYIICWVAMPANANRYTSPFDEQQQTAGDSEKNKRVLGIALIIIGAAFLLDRIFLWFDLNIIIPLGIIVVALIILINARK